MRNKSGKIEGKASSIMGSGVSNDFVGHSVIEAGGIKTRVDLSAGCGRDCGADELSQLRFSEDALVPLFELVVNGEHTSNSSPFGSHIGNSETFVNGQVLDPRTGKFDSGIEDFVLVEKTSESNDNVLTCHARR